LGILGRANGERDATKEKILRIIADELPRKTGSDDRILFFFASHGQTEELQGGIKRGFLILVDRGLDDLYAESIPRGYSLGIFNIFNDFERRHWRGLRLNCPAGRQEIVPL
jgi:hypothetical protein